MGQAHAAGRRARHAARSEHRNARRNDVLLIEELLHRQLLAAQPRRIIYDRAADSHGLRGGLVGRGIELIVSAPQRAQASQDAGWAEAEAVPQMLESRAFRSPCCGLPTASGPPRMLRPPVLWGHSARLSVHCPQAVLKLLLLKTVSGRAARPCVTLSSDSSVLSYD